MSLLKKSGRKCDKRSLEVCAATDSFGQSHEALLADATFREIPSASGLFPSFVGAILSSVAHSIICIFLGVDPSPSTPSKKKRKKISPPRRGKCYRGTFCFGDPRFDVDLRALESDQKSNAIEWTDVRHLAPPITTGQSTLSPDIALNEDNLLKTWALWELFQSHKQGEINRVLSIGAKTAGQSDVRPVLSLRVTSWMRSTFEKSFTRKSQSRDFKRYLVFADENNTKYPRSILLLQKNWVLQIECEANCDGGTIAGLFDRCQQLGICFGWSFSSKTDIHLFLYAGDNENEASTKELLERCRLKLFCVSVPGFESLPMDATVVLDVSDTKKVAKKYTFRDEVSLYPSVVALSVDSSSTCSPLPTLPRSESAISGTPIDFRMAMDTYNALVPEEMRDVNMEANLSVTDSSLDASLPAEYGLPALYESPDALNAIARMSEE